MPKSNKTSTPAPLRIQEIRRTKIVKNKTKIWRVFNNPDITAKEIRKFHEKHNITSEQKFRETCHEVYDSIGDQCQKVPFFLRISPIPDHVKRVTIKGMDISLR